MDHSPLATSKKEFFGILSLRGNLRQTKIRESFGLIEKYFNSD
jgi:hypothetical protein